jgi:hypothetical protein
MLWRQTKTQEWLGERKDSQVAGTHDWLGERAILAGKNKDVEEHNNIIQSITGKGHSNAWPGTASNVIFY